MKKIATSVSVIMWLLATSVVHAQLTVEFNFDGSAGNEVSFAPSSVSEGLVAGDISRGSGLTPASAAGAFSSSDFTLASSLDANDYYTFTVGPAAGNLLSLSALSFSERRSSTGPLNLSIRSSEDSFASDIFTFAMPDNASARNHTLSLSGFIDLAGPVEFRLYGFGAESLAGTWRLDDIVLSGSVTPVPEPAEYAVAVGLLLSIFALGRRRWKQQLS